jgi:hypothetical protein
LIFVGPEAADNRWLREAFEIRVPNLFSRHRARRLSGHAANVRLQLGRQAVESMHRVWAPDQETLAPRVARGRQRSRSDKKVIERIQLIDGGYALID